MTTALIIFSIATLVAATLLLNKKRELVQGKGFFTVGSPALDRRIADISTDIEIYLIETDSKKIKSYIKRFVMKVENRMLKALHVASQRFEVIGHVVTGRDIPKNRGSVSFFLKNIENDKKGRLIK
ncbi:MAG: hypothetical protein FGM57_03540 [Candidatus Taylorbacteria bacterium]|nr:hypothetical protein [Candidatus Taylorbacteria bacterium]